MKVALTDMGVQKLPPGTYFDTKTAAFGIRVGKNRRTWIVTQGQRPRRTVTLGHYPALTLAEARKKAYSAFVAPEVAKAQITFPEAVESFLALDRWRPGSKRVLASSLKHFPWKGQLQKLTHEQVIAALDAIKSPSARAHALKDIRTFFNWCVPRYLSASPAAGIKMDKQPSRDRVLTDDELKRVWIAAEQMGNFGRIVKLLILTGQRRSEIGSLKWDYIKGDRITLPAEVTKNGREHSFPIGSFTSKLLSNLPTRSAQSTWLFPARTHVPEPATSSSFNGWSKSHATLLSKSGTRDWTLHDLRRTFATNMAAMGVRQEVTEKLLNHVSGSVSGVAAIYNRHSYFSEMAEALRLWEERVLSLVARQ